MQQAVQNGDAEKCRQLISDGADANAIMDEEEQITVLMKAAELGRADICHILIAGGAKVDAITQPEGQSALSYAAQSRSTETCRVLLQAGADVNHMSRAVFTPLHIAAHCGDFDMCRQLIAAGANVTTPDRFGNTPLHTAIQAAGESGVSPEQIEKIVILLLKAGADPNAVNDSYNDEMRPIDMAELQGLTNIVELLANWSDKPTYTHGAPSLSEITGGIPGTLVIHDFVTRKHLIYNDDIILHRKSPGSTFQIITALIAFDLGIISPGNSERTWSGETFWNDEWNRDQNFHQAFRNSCEWYFRQLADEIGKERMAAELHRLNYGNCDISDWEGKLSASSERQSANGFWLESSLLISPEEQLRALERALLTGSHFPAKGVTAVTNAMKVYEDNRMKIYGKSGVDTIGKEIRGEWFIGYTQKYGDYIFFSLYLDRNMGSAGENPASLSGHTAKMQAIKFIIDYWQNIK